jgi:hypothetical protein
MIAAVLLVCGALASAAFAQGETEQEWDLERAISAPDGDSEEFLAASIRDAQRWVAGFSYSESSDLEFGWDASHGPQLVGLRFADLEIPAGAQVSEAYISLSADSAGAGSLELTIAAQAEAGPAPFMQDPEGQGSADLSSRPTTAATVSWSPEPWVAGTTYRSPDISSVLQEILDAPAWTSGGAVVVLIRPVDPENRSLRSAYSFDARPTRAPTLLVRFADSEPDAAGETAPGPDGQGAETQAEEPEPAGPEQAQPEPAGPERVEPEQVGPEQVGPEQAEPEQVAPQRVEPVEPQPTEPEPTEPQPTEPEPTEPEPVEPEPIQPQPVEPAPVEPEQVEPEQVEPRQEATPRAVPERRRRPGEQVIVEPVQPAQPALPDERRAAAEPVQPEPQRESAAPGEPRRVRYHVAANHARGVRGSVLLSDYGAGDTIITVFLDNPATDAEYAVSIHSGACGSAGSLVAALEPVSGSRGFATSLLALKLAALTSGGYHLNVYQTAEGFTRVAGCADMGS